MGLAIAVAVMTVAASVPRHFDVSGTFVPGGPAGPAGISVRFAPHDPDLLLNEEPAPRIALDAVQRVLVDKQKKPSGRAADWDPETATYLDTSVPVVFPVAVRADAPKGVHDVRGTVTFFYCSKREGWCRRGTAEVTVAVRVK